LCCPRAAIACAEGVVDQRHVVPGLAWKPLEEALLLRLGLFVLAVGQLEQTGRDSVGEVHAVGS